MWQMHYKSLMLHPSVTSSKHLAKSKRADVRVTPTGYAHWLRRGWAGLMSDAPAGQIEVKTTCRRPKQRLKTHARALKSHIQQFCSRGSSQTAWTSWLHVKERIHTQKLYI